MQSAVDYQPTSVDFDRPESWRPAWLESTHRWHCLNYGKIIVKWLLWHLIVRCREGQVTSAPIRVRQTQLPEFGKGLKIWRTSVGAIYTPSGRNAGEVIQSDRHRIRNVK